MCRLLAALGRARLALLTCWVFVLCAALPAAAQDVPRLVTASIDNARTVVLRGNVRPEVRTAKDLGALADAAPIAGMQLLLQRPPQTQAALDRLTETQLRRGSPEFHHWLTPAEMTRRFAPAPADVAAVAGWLRAQGFVVDGRHSAGMIVDFSGTAGQVRAAFHADLHALDAGGVRHIANVTDPTIPQALAGVVRGVVSLNDFRPHTNVVRRAPNYTVSGGYYIMTPADLAKIYNLTPLFEAGISGQGQTIAVIEDTNAYAANDWTRFRAAFGLSRYPDGTLTTVHPAGASGGCGNPGVVSGDEAEATLDAQWASAAAPSAAIVLASCTDTQTTFGGLIALQNLLDAPGGLGVVSISYGECEAENGATQNAAYNTVYQQAATQGIAVFVSSGDEMAASCDANQTLARHGIAVSGFASTPYNVAVGGTDFSDTYSGTTSTYWNSTNTSAYGSARSYIPEIPWNDSCANSLISAYNNYSTNYGSNSFCNSSQGQENYLTTAGGSGGPSGCATGAPATAGVVGGSCAGYAKPPWQQVYGLPADGVRDLPDVSLFAANGVWGHYLVYCDNDLSDGGAPCGGAPSAWSGAGGTSFSAPILAAIQALVIQKTGALQGNPAPVYYSLANTEYGARGSVACDSSRGATGGAALRACIFHDVTLGDIVAPCPAGSPDCYRPSGTYGVSSTGRFYYKPAYQTGRGWDFATGIGSVNAANLVNGWPTTE